MHDNDAELNAYDAYLAELNRHGRLQVNEPHGFRQVTPARAPTPADSLPRALRKRRSAPFDDGTEQASGPVLAGLAEQPVRHSLLDDPSAVSGRFPLLRICWAGLGSVDEQDLVAGSHNSLGSHGQHVSVA